MARIDYADPAGEPVKALAERIIAERGSLLHLYRMLMHSAPIAEGWLAYLSSIRHQALLDDAIRELAIMRIAHLNRAPYEAEQHAPIALRAGLSQAQLKALTSPEPDLALFNARERAVLAYTDAMTVSIQVPDATFDAVNSHFAQTELVELTATIAAYNMVSRFLEALQISMSDPIK